MFVSRMQQKMKWNLWKCYSTISLAGQTMVLQMLVVNILHWTSFWSQQLPIKMGLVPLLFTAGEYQPKNAFLEVIARPTYLFLPFGWLLQAC